MAYKSPLWMKHLYTHEKLFDNKGIRITNTNQNTAVIIEPRKTEMLQLVVKNVMYYLHKDWNLLIFCGTQNYDLVKTMCDTLGSVSIICMQTDNLTIRDYNLMCTSENFYNMIPTENILIFQIDVLLRKKIPIKMLEYAYVGAPWNKSMLWAKHLGYIGNGGLSLRRKSFMIDACRIIQSNIVPRMNEDGMIAWCCKYANFPMPSFEEASSFSVETVLHNDPIGMHKPHFTEEQMNDLFIINEKTLI